MYLLQLDNPLHLYRLWDPEVRFQRKCLARTEELMAGKVQALRKNPPAPHTIAGGQSCWISGRYPRHRLVIDFCALVKAFAEQTRLNHAPAFQTYTRHFTDLFETINIQAVGACARVPEMQCMCLHAGTVQQCRPPMSIHSRTPLLKGRCAFIPCAAALKGPELTELCTALL